ncbi:alpha-1,3-mannosyl-glycoprotein 2-beta-N-acetylglucosaminyltransferase [Tanacetum coccineum]
MDLIALSLVKVKLQKQECEQLRAVVQELEKNSVSSLMHGANVPVEAVVIMAYNHADYLERTIESILKYHGSVALKFLIFVFQDGSNSDVRTKAMGYDQLTYMQRLDNRPVHTERPGELIAYYKIASEDKLKIHIQFLLVCKGFIQSRQISNQGTTSFQMLC